MANKIIRLFNLLHQPFRQFIPRETFRYGICGGLNLALDTILYFVFFQFVFLKQNIDLQFIILSPHITSLFAVFPITFIIGFLLNKYIVFTKSNINSAHQLFRYFISGGFALTLSYLSMIFLVDYLNLYPTPSRFITIIITVCISYLIQQNFTFKNLKSKK